jgi:hypothetical protein
MEGCKIYDRESGLLLARAQGVENAERIFVARGGSWDNAVVVKGDVDVKVHDLACFWVQQYSWLCNYLRKHIGNLGTAEKLEISLERLSLWLRIQHSRELQDTEFYSAPVASVFGEGLASEVDFLHRLARRGCETFGPDTSKIWRAAFAAANSMCRTYRVPYVVGWHKRLGVITVSPEAVFCQAPAGFEMRQLVTITRR